MELTGKFNENYIDEQTGERVKAAVADLSEEQCYELARKMLETLAEKGFFAPKYRGLLFFGADVDKGHVCTNVQISTALLTLLLEISYKNEPKGIELCRKLSTAFFEAAIKLTEKEN